MRVSRDWVSRDWVSRDRSAAIAQRRTLSRERSAAIESAAMRIVGRRDGEVARVWVNGAILTVEPSLQFFRHSKGFNWGYGGSGPAQLALAILLNAGVSPERAVRVHQAFKSEFLVPLSDDLFALEVDVLAWTDAVSERPFP